MVAAEQGHDGTWGVGTGSAWLYEPQFTRITAEAIADMENSESPPADWTETNQRLVWLGLPTTPTADAEGRET
jgi:hypothetical protein